MQKRLILFLGLFLIVFSTIAQKEENSGRLSTGETAELISRDIIEFDNPIMKDVVHLQQIGNQNELSILQQIDNRATYILTAEQIGNKNIGYIDQNGDNHESLLLQRGNSNTANLWSIGSSTHNSVYQDGHNNQVDSFIQNQLPATKSATSIQQGNNNFINLNFLSGVIDPTPNGMLIDQGGTGNMADVTIDNFNVPYLKIEQTGGAKVIINNSDFNYPMK